MTKKYLTFFCQKYFPHFSFSTFFDLNFQPHTLKPQKSNSTRNFRQSAIFLASNGQNFIDFEQFFGFFADFPEMKNSKRRFTDMLRPRDPDRSIEQTTWPRAILISSHMIGSLATSGNFSELFFRWAVTCTHKNLGRSRAIIWIK